VVTHVPVMPGSCEDSCLAWNYESVLDIIRDSDVCAVFAGHDHLGGFCEEGEITFVTMPSPMVAQNKIEEPLCHCLITLNHDFIEIEGKGTVKSMKINARN